MVIHIKKCGYDPFIDFLKGWCILMVVLTHTVGEIKELTIFSIWGGQAVPIFLLIQVFHAYKAGFIEQKSLINKNVFKRVLCPFIIVTALSLIIKLLISPEKSQEIFYDCLVFGGNAGPGAYYVWIYLQIALLLMFLRRAFLKYNKTQLLIVFIIVCEALEVVCSVINMNQNLYALLAIRYLFLIYLGYIWSNGDIDVTPRRLGLSLLSIATILLLHYTKQNFMPWLYESRWRDYHWFTYFNAAFLLTWILYAIYKCTEAHMPFFNKYLKIIGAASIEIYFFQMLVCEFWPYSFTGSSIIVVALSVLPAIYIHHFIEFSTVRNR